mgnify:CR=1 FL=1
MFGTSSGGFGGFGGFGSGGFTPATPPLAAAVAAPTSNAQGERAAKFAQHLTALNAQFATHIAGCKSSKSRCLTFWEKACEDYLKYVREMKRDFADVLDKSVVPGGNAFAAPAAVGALASAGGAGGAGDVVSGDMLLFGTGDCGQLGFGDDVCTTSLALDH